MKMYITYGADTAQAKNFSVVEGEDDAECTAKASLSTGNTYDMLWSEAIFPSVQEKFGLTEIPPQREIIDDTKGY